MTSFIFTFISFPKDWDISSTWYFLGGLTGGPTFSVSNMRGGDETEARSGLHWLAWDRKLLSDNFFLDQNIAE